MNNRWVKLIFFLMAFQLMNMSIDIPAAELKHTASTDNFNYIDTYIEFITEVIFKYENAIPEAKHRHQRVLQTHQQLLVICQHFDNGISTGLRSVSLKAGYPDYSNHYAFQFTTELMRPPSLS